MMQKNHNTKSNITLRNRVSLKVTVVVIFLAAILALNVFAYFDKQGALFLGESEESQDGDINLGLLGESHTNSAQWELKPNGINTWKEVHEILKLSPEYDQSLLEWLIENNHRYAEEVSSGVTLLVKNQSANEAIDFLLWIEFLQSFSNETEPLERLNHNSIYNTALFTKRGEVLMKNEEHSAISNLGPDIKALNKTVEPTDDFRHYQVTLELQPRESGELEYQTATDTVLLMDVSESIGIEKLQHMQSLATLYARETLSTNGQNRVALVTYNDDAIVQSNFVSSSGLNTLLHSIQQLESAGNANMQMGLLKAHNLFSREDTNNRKQVVVHLTDGLINKQYTDLQPYLYPSNSSLDEDMPEAFAKRWSFVSQEENGDSTPTVFINHQFQDATPKNIALLESQYIASQNIEMYVVDYSNGENWAQDFVCEMKQPPNDFNYPDNYPSSVRRHNPLQETGILNHDHRVVKAENTTGLFKMIENITEPSEIESPAFYVEDTFNTELFEIVGSPKRIRRNDVEQTVQQQDGTIQWISSGENLTDLRALTYTLRVLDRPLIPEGTDIHNENLEHSLLSDQFTLSYSSGQTNINHQQDTPYYVSIDPLVESSAEIVNLSGEPIIDYPTHRKINLLGEISKGSGSYKYQWLQNGEILSEPISIKNNDENSIAFNYTTEELPNGEHTLVLKVIDIGATQAGYKSNLVSSLEIPLKVHVLFGQVTVEVQGPEGAFETEIHITNDNKVQQWHYIGAGTYTFDAPIGSTVSVDTYAPAGYRTQDSANKNQTLSKDSQQIYFQTIISPAPTPYFFNWSWQIPLKKEVTTK